MVHACTVSDTSQCIQYVLILCGGKVVIIVGTSSIKINQQFQLLAKSIDTGGGGTACVYIVAISNC